LAFFIISLGRACLVSAFLLIAMIYPNYSQHRFESVLKAPAIVLSLPPLAIGHLSRCLRSPVLFSPVRPGCDAIVDPRWIVRRHLWTTAVLWLLMFYAFRLSMEALKRVLKTRTEPG
jgi:hypothetical protein